MADLTHSEETEWDQSSRKHVAAIAERTDKVHICPGDLDGIGCGRDLWKRECSRATEKQFELSRAKPFLRPS
jgi:hypothetical protein